MNNKLRTVALVSVLGLVAMLAIKDGQAQIKVPPKLAPKPPAPIVKPIVFKSISVSPQLRQALRTKQHVNLKLLKNNIRYRGNLPVIKIRGTRNYVLQRAVSEPKGQVQRVPLTLAKKLTRYKGYYSKLHIGKAVKLPIIADIVDHRSKQTEIRDQGSRGTCVAHAALAGLEGYYKRQGHIRNISENHAYNVFMAQEGSTCMADTGLQTWRAADYMRDNRVCSEALSPYLDTTSSVCAVISSACNSNKRYGYTSAYKFFAPAFGGTGTAIATNPNYLESIVKAGYDIVLGVYVAGSDWFDGSAETGTVDVQTYSNGQPANPYGGHAMLLVGYNKSNNYFIFKNSWGTDAGHNGYFYLSYEYLETYAKYGYVILGATPA